MFGSIMLNIAYVFVIFVWEGTSNENLNSFGIWNGKILAMEIV